MKKLFPLILSGLLGFCSLSRASIGDSFTPVVVMAVRAETSQPVEGLEVWIEGSKKYTEMDLDPARHRKVFGDSLGKKVKTNGIGTAVLLSYRKFVESDISGKSIVSYQPYPGTIVATLNGKEVYRKTMEEWVKESGYKDGSASAPIIIIEVKK